MKTLTNSKSETLRLWKLAMVCGDDRNLFKTPYGNNRHCFCKLEVTGEDVGYRMVTTQEGGEKKSYGVICPECGEFTELPVDVRDIPAYIKYFAMEV